MAGAASLAVLTCACHDKPSAATQRGSAVLDRMQLAAARRVGLESAVDAMDRGDLQRLKMLKVWVLGRAQVVLFEPADLKSLDLAIACLDGSLPREKREAALDAIESGTLVRSARELCLDEED